MRRAFAILAAMAALAGAQDPPKKAKHFWVGATSGTSVKFKFTEEGGRTGVEEYLVKETTDDQFAFYRTLTVGESIAEQKEIAEFHADRCVHCAPASKPAGEETLKIGDKEYKCQVYKWTSTVQPIREVRTWIAEGVAWPVKSDWKMAAKGAHTSWQAVSVSEEIEAGGKKYACVKVEGTDQFGSGVNIKFTMWFSPEVPGGVVKAAVEGKQFGKDIKATRVLESVETPK